MNAQAQSPQAPALPFVVRCQHGRVIQITTDETNIYTSDRPCCPWKDSAPFEGTVTRENARWA